MSCIGGGPAPVKLSQRTQSVVFLVVLGIAIAGVYGLVQATQSPPVAPARVAGVSLLVETPAWTIAYGPVTTTNNTAYAILIEASQRLHFSVDPPTVNGSFPAEVFVTAINGTTNGQDGLWWQYWVNGVYGNTAANLYPLHDGDSVAWRFTPSQEGAAG